MISETFTEISRNYPKGAVDWLRNKRPDVWNNIKKTEDKINTFCQLSDETNLKMALNLVKGLYGEGFELFKESTKPVQGELF
jgi:hypothetical protein